MTALTLTGVLVVATAASFATLVACWMVVAWALRPVRRSSESELPRRPWLDPNER